MQTARNHNNRDVYSFSLSQAQNTRIVILNEKTGRSVVITPEGTPAQFELSPFFIEELRQGTLGDTDRFLIVETDADFSVRSTA